MTISKPNSRTVKIPMNIIIADENGKELHIIKQTDMPIMEYFKLCISLNFVNEKNVIPGRR